MEHLMVHWHTRLHILYSLVYPLEVEHRSAVALERMLVQEMVLCMCDGGALLFLEKELEL